MTAATTDNAAIDDLVERADVALTAEGEKLPARESQGLMLDLADLLRRELRSEYLQLLDLAQNAHRAGEQSDDVRHLEMQLRQIAIERAQSGAPTDQVDKFREDLVRGAVVAQELDRFSLSHAIWWLAKSGTPLDSIEGVMRRHLPKLASSEYNN